MGSVYSRSRSIWLTHFYQSSYSRSRSIQEVGLIEYLRYVSNIVKKSYCAIWFWHKEVQYSTVWLWLCHHNRHKKERKSFVKGSKDRIFWASSFAFLQGVPLTTDTLLLQKFSDFKNFFTAQWSSYIGRGWQNCYNKYKWLKPWHFLIHTKWMIAHCGMRMLSLNFQIKPFLYQNLPKNEKSEKFKGYFLKYLDNST